MPEFHKPNKYCLVMGNSGSMLPTNGWHLVEFNQNAQIKRKPIIFMCPFLCTKKPSSNHSFKPKELLHLNWHRYCFWNLDAFFLIQVTHAPSGFWTHNLMAKPFDGKRKNILSRRLRLRQSPRKKNVHVR